MNGLQERLASLTPEQHQQLALRLRAGAPTAAAPDGIAIVAAACRLPGGVRSPADLWRLLIEARDAITEVPADRWDGAALYAADPAEPGRMNSRCGGFLDGVDQFDAAFFGISPREAAQMDPQQRMLLELSWEALEAGGQAADRLAGSHTGVYIGAHNHSADYYLLQLAQSGGIESHSATGSAHSILANRISYLLDFRGPSLTVDTACSSSLVAVHLACQSLRSGECELALAGGINLMLLPPASMQFCKLQILSSDGRCRSFDAGANGIVRAEGGALVVLKRLADAERDGDPVLAVIRGSAINQDGASNGLTAPNGPAQEAVVRRALKLAGIAADSVGLFETHGTGTSLGDPVEVEALANVLGPPRSPDSPCYLGALKTNLGHLEAAAGIAGLLKAVLCLQHQQIPPNLHFQRLNPHIELSGTPFRIPTSVCAWPERGQPRAAGVSSFGFGGTNAHVVLQEHRAQPSRERAAPPGEAREQLLAVSARSAAALHALVLGHCEHLGRLPAQQLPDYVYTATARRAHGPHRIAVMGKTAAELARVLEARLGAGPGVTSPSDGAAGVVFVYSGQGGQWPSMGRELLETEPVFREAVQAVARRFQTLAGWDLLAVLAEPQAKQRLAATEVAQPAIFALQIGLTALWRAWGVAPAALIGHSVGEIAAAHAGGVLTLDEAVALVFHRSRLMQPAAGGRMAQVELAPEELRPELACFGDRLSIAAHNGPASTVVAGDASALHELLERPAIRGAGTRVLPVDYAFHSAQMTPFCAPLARAVDGLRPQPASLPLVSTVTGRWSSSDDFNAAYWARNIREPVLLAEGIDELLRAGFRHFVEIGPHPSLGAGILGCALEQETQALVVGSLRRERPTRPALLASLGSLYEAACALDWRALSQPDSRVVELPSYPWQRQRYWLDNPDPAVLAFHALGRQIVAREEEASTQGYEVRWERMPAAAPERSTLNLQLDQLAAAGARLALELPGASALAAEGEALQDIESRAIEHTLGALRRLGFTLSPGEPIGPASSAGVANRHARLWEHLLEMLGEDGALQRSGDHWVATASAARRHGPRHAKPPSRIEAALLERCGDALAEVLRGDVDPLALLFPEGEGASATAMYGQAAAALVYNRLLAETVALAATTRSGGPLRLLEIGAGTGATTAVLLEHLPADTSYCFTDISVAFLQSAALRFAGAAARLSYRSLDIEQPPRDQGFADGSFDVVVASNVMHATGDLRQALRHARSLLAPGGLLVLLESVASRRWLSLTFGLTSGWWRFRDSALRSKQPTLPTPGWLEPLHDAGFDEASVVGESLSTNSLHPQAILLARAAPHATAEPHHNDLRDSNWVVIADAGGVGETLAAQLAQRGAECRIVTGPEAEDGATLVQLIRSFQQRPGATRCGVVHCAALDVPTGDATTLGKLETFLDGGLCSALRTAQTLGSAATQRPLRLWLVTRSALRVDNSERELSPAQAPLWGFGRSMALEQPQCWGGLVDIGADLDVDAAAAAVLCELNARDQEDQVAWRRSGRHVARLVRRSDPPAARLSLDPEASYLITGGYGSLAPRIAQWLADQGARLIVLLSRSALVARSEWDPLPDEHPQAAVVRAVRALEAQGVTVRTEQGDVCDPHAMARLCEQLHAAGTPLRGVVHAAAAFAFSPLGAITAASLRDALKAKVEGAWVLHELTRETPLDLFVLFSSVTTVLGAKGLAAYAAANHFLGTLASYRAMRELPAVCVDWGVWAEDRAGWRERRGDVAGVGFLHLDERRAFDLLGRLVAAAVPHSVVAKFDARLLAEAYQGNGERRFLQHFTFPAAAVVNAVPEAAPASDLAKDLALVSAPERIERMSLLVRQELTRVLGLARAEDIDAATGFFELGLDSLMAVQLRRRLSAATGLSLPATLTFNYATVTALSAHLLERLSGAQAAPAPAAPVPAYVEPAQDGAEPLEALPDEQVRALLLAELAELPESLRATGAGEALS